MKDPFYDAIIVGAGPGGSATAIELARGGWRVLLVEKGVFPRDKVCGDLIGPRSLRVLEDLGCGPAVDAAARNRLDGGILYVNGRQIVTAEIPESWELPAYGYAIPRLIFDEIVFRQAQAVGAETVEGCQVKNITFEADGVTVYGLQERRERRFRGRLVIGADGVHSIVARVLGMEQRDTRSIIVALRAYYDNVAGDPSQVDLFFDEAFFPGYGWIFHLGDGRANVGLGMVREVYMHHEINLRRCFDDWVTNDPHVQGRLGDARLDGRIVGWPLNTFRQTGGNYAERALLVGDAGSFIDPINGEGIHTALETAVIAAGVVDQALRADDLSASFLSRYERAWRAALDLDLRTADLFVTIIQNRSLNPLWMWLLNMIGERAIYDPVFAETCGGILTGITPTHHSLSPFMALKALAQHPQIWARSLNPPDAHRENGGGLLNLGLAAGSKSLDALSEMIEDPLRTAAWGGQVARKGFGLGRELGRRYVLGTLQFMFGDD
jgi:geranylgeranyl reductase family protein